MWAGIIAVLVCTAFIGCTVAMHVLLEDSRPAFPASPGG
jgi:hypothetical protein